MESNGGVNWVRGATGGREKDDSGARIASPTRSGSYKRADSDRSETRAGVVVAKDGRRNGQIAAREREE